jgi:hypothetical protein
MECHIQMRKVLLLAGLCLVSAPAVHAGMPVITTEGDVRLDVTRFPLELRDQVELVNAKCTTCHSLARVVEAIETGRTTSGAPFDRYFVRSLIIKKRRNPAASFTAEEAKAIMQFLGYVQDNPALYALK